MALLLMFWINVHLEFFMSAKEIRLRHGAPVIGIQALDRSGLPLPGPLEVQHERAKAPDMTGSHFVLICSQQQLKVLCVFIACCVLAPVPIRTVKLLSLLHQLSTEE